MSKKESITHSGDSAVDRFVKDFGTEMASKLYPNSPKGDVRCVVPTDYSGVLDFIVEVKKNTNNQTRPSKYVSLAMLDEESGLWLVGSPNILLRYGLGRKGQHTEDGARCISGMSKKLLKVCKGENLRYAIIAAYLEGELDKPAKRIVRHINNRYLEIIKENRRMLEEYKKGNDMRYLLNGC